MRNFCSIKFNYTRLSLMNTKSYIIQAENQLLSIAESILQSDLNNRIFCFYGDLGAGKTSFIKAFGQCLQIQDSIVSPTYSIINEYEGKTGLIYHMDLYRLNSLEEAFNIGIEDYLYSGQYNFIEWPELIDTILPNHHKIKIEQEAQSTRKIVHLYN